MTYTPPKGWEVEIQMWSMRNQIENDGSICGAPAEDMAAQWWDVIVRESEIDMDAPGWTGEIKVLEEGEDFDCMKEAAIFSERMAEKYGVSVEHLP